MYSFTHLLTFSAVAQQVAQSPTLSAAKNALISAGQWSEACLQQQAQALCDGSMTNAEPLAAALRRFPGDGGAGAKLMILSVFFRVIPWQMRFIFNAM